MVQEILKRYQIEKCLSDADLQELLCASGAEREAVFEAARTMRSACFGDEVFLYGFVYFSTYCKNSCNFCFYRKQNGLPPRYRKSKEEIVQTAVQLERSGVHLIDLTMGEDPYYHIHFAELTDLVHSVKEQTGLPVMISPGVLPESGIRELAEAGADWYALYQETYTKPLFDTLREGQDYAQRMECKQTAAKCGMLLEEGLLTGVGDTLEDRIYALREMGKIGTSQVRTMTFVSQKGTPMEQDTERDASDELLHIAVMRLLYPNQLIPASLDVDGSEGLRSRLMAGANVITSIIPPLEGYAGVAQAEHGIDDSARTVAGISGIIASCGLKIAAKETYQKWIEARKKDEAVSHRM